MRVRRLGPADDLSAAIVLLQRFFREEGFDTPDPVIAANLRRMAELEICAVLLAEDGESPAGIATVSMEFGIEYGWSAELGDLYVAPDHRGRGVAKALISAADAFLRDKGAAGYQVTVTPEAEAAHGLHSFYRKLGFDDEGRVLLFRKL